MQRLMGIARKAITEYNMLGPGDRIAVGVSGGKDSVALLYVLARLREYIGIGYQLAAITIDPCFDGRSTDYSAIEQLCQSLEIPYQVCRTDIAGIIFDTRRESNPCSLCARMRRGALHDMTKELGCNKIALGHHRDDAVETFIMNLFNEGRISCFSPVTYLSRKDITMIRPLCLASEAEVIHGMLPAGLPVVKSKCPVDGHTEREWTKNWLREMETEHPGLSKRMFGAMRRGHVAGW